MKTTYHGKKQSRRAFLKATSGVALTAAVSSLSPAGATASTRSAVDLVPLGSTGVEICRLGIGTGSEGGSIQRALGQDRFTRLIRYAVDRGVTYIDTADAYKTHEMIRNAIKGVPREKLFIQSKMPWQGPPMTERPLEVLDLYRKELGTDYIDSLLLHCTTDESWPEDLARMMDAFSEAKEKGIIRLKGVSCHGLSPLVRATGVDWVDVHLVRVNPQGKYVDSRTSDWSAPGDVPAVLNEIEQMHRAGRGVIGMKIIGNGDFTNPTDREKSIRYAMNCQSVDAVVIGFKNESEIDEAISRINSALLVKAA